MKQYVLFGCGYFGQVALHLLKEKGVAYFLDNNSERQGTDIEGVPVFSLAEKVQDLAGKQVVITVSEEHTEEIARQLQAAQVPHVMTWQDCYRELMEARAGKSRDNLEIYRCAIDWVQEHTLSTGGIVTTTLVHKGYPEVTGYFIPTLLRWGYRDLAISYAKWLLSIQHDSGAWYDTQGKKPYVFDTGQVLKGLVAIHDILPEVMPAIRKGCDWLLSQIDAEGRFHPADAHEFDRLEHVCAERIHLYCLSPIRDSAKLLNEPRYEQAVQRCVKWYKEHQHDAIVDFDLLSHFHAYVMEALVDLGERDLAREAMARMASYMTTDGAVPAYHDVHWVCSTGLFQLALTWFKLGDVELGNRAFAYACQLQNTSGGWFGSYPQQGYPEEKNTYFPVEEIPWAVKYFLDALAAKNKAEFEGMSDIFLDTVRRDDGLYQTVRETVGRQAEKAHGQKIRVLDVGCGKGRYLKNLVEDIPNAAYYAVDLSRSVMEYIGLPQVEKKQGSLTQIPYPDGTFDVVYACESLEHAIDISSAVHEMCRVAHQGGAVVIIDKNDLHVGEVMIEPWEQWFHEGTLQSLLERDCKNVEIRHGVPYHGWDIKDMFSAWIGTKA